MYTVFKADATEGIVLARILQYVRPMSRHGVSDQDIYDRGFLNFNNHPDQRSAGPSYTVFGGYGTKVYGLPVRLMEGMRASIEHVSKGGLSPAEPLRSKSAEHNDGAILLARFTLDQVVKMRIGVNIPFDSGEGQPYTDLVPDVRRDGVFLNASDNLAKLNPVLRERFDSDGHLIGSHGEFYVRVMPPAEEYRDGLLVFRPNRKGKGFRKYWAKDIEFNLF